MKTRSVIIIGFLILLAIFGVASSIQWNLSQQIELVSEYHVSMSVPALIVLQDIRTGYQSMHFSTMQIVLNDLKGDDMLEENYKTNLENVKYSIDNYNNLAFVKNSVGDFLAPPMMQEQMQNYALIYKSNIEEHDKALKQFRNSELTNKDIENKLEALEFDFHNTMQENSLMEINGMQKTQNQILSIEKNFEKVFLVSSIAAAATSLIVVIIISKFVSRPIDQLVDMTNKIAKGEFVTIKKIYKSSLDYS